jgi:PAS domain S-box-containing protein
MPLHVASLVAGLASGVAVTGAFAWWKSRRKTERLSSQAAMLPIQALLDSIDDLAWIKDRDSRFILVNRKFGEVFGRDPASLIGKTDFDLSAPDMAEQYLHDDLQVMRTGQPSRREERISRGPGVFGWSETIKVAVLDAVGQVVGTAGVARDITERRQAQAMLEQRVDERTQELSNTVDQLRTAQRELVTKEKMAALGSMVAGVAHELNTPIGNSLTVASTLQDHTRNFESVLQGGLTRSALDSYVTANRDGTEILLSSLLKAAELVSSFKQVAVDQASTNRRRFLLDKTVAEIVMTMGPVLKKFPHRLEVDIPPGVVMDTYPGPLGQVLTNLITNAMLHAFESRTDGVVRVTTEPVEAGRVKILVQDDGDGIAEDHVSRVFDPFFTTKLGHGGSGLGLSIVYTLVNDALKGTVSVQTQRDTGTGHGTCFTLLLPLEIQ